MHFLAHLKLQLAGRGRADGTVSGLHINRQTAAAWAGSGQAAGVLPGSPWVYQQASSGPSAGREQAHRQVSSAQVPEGRNESRRCASSPLDPIDATRKQISRFSPRDRLPPHLASPCGCSPLSLRRLATRSPHSSHHLTTCSPPFCHASRPVRRLASLRPRAHFEGGGGSSPVLESSWASARFLRIFCKRNSTESQERIIGRNCNPIFSCDN